MRGYPELDLVQHWFCVTLDQRGKVRRRPCVVETLNVGSITREDGVGSIEATKRITKMTHNSAVIGISALDDPIYPYYFFNAGAKGFIHANDQINDFLEAIQTVKQGRIYQSALTNAQIRPPISSKRQPFILLTERELQVAILTAQGDHSSLIAKKLNISMKSSQTYKVRILKKLNLSNDVELSHFAIKYNLIHIRNTD